MSRHATPETHTSLLHSVLGLIASAGRYFQSDIRAALTTKHVNPVVEFVAFPAGVTVRSDGVVIVPQNTVLSRHLRWRINQFNLVPFESLDPVKDYQNGLQIVSSDGVLSGHAHLHVMKLSDAPDVARAAAGVPGVAMPASYKFFGGHQWYKTTKIADGSALLDAQVIPTLETDALHLMTLELVHVDDTQLTPALHGQFCGSLTTVFLPVA